MVISRVICYNIGAQSKSYLHYYTLSDCFLIYFNMGAFNQYTKLTTRLSSLVLLLSHTLANQNQPPQPPYHPPSCLWMIPSEIKGEVGIIWSNDAICCNLFLEVSINDCWYLMLSWGAMRYEKIGNLYSLCYNRVRILAALQKLCPDMMISKV